MTSIPRRKSAFAVYALKSPFKTLEVLVAGESSPNGAHLKRCNVQLVDTSLPYNASPSTSNKKQRKRKKIKSLGKKKKVIRKSQSTEFTTDDVKSENTDTDEDNTKIADAENTSFTSNDDLERRNESISSQIINRTVKEEETPSGTLSHDISSGNAWACDVFEYLIRPLDTDYFFEELFEKKPCHIKRNSPLFYRGLFTSEDFKMIMKENYLNYGKHIDITAYVDGERRPVLSDQPVTAEFVWKHYLEGNSVRMRNPQTYSKDLWKMCSLLQEYFSSSVGANMYLTPARSQGFPPHYDDIDAFVLQIEGKKHWKIYKPESEDQMLPLYPSGDLIEDDLGLPYLEADVEAGDLLYIPRGWVHQAFAPDDYSLHITISTNQLNTWSDFLKAGLTSAVALAAEKNLELRKSIPKDFYDHVGFTYTTPNSASQLSKRVDIMMKTNQLLEEVIKEFPIDNTADNRAFDFIHSCMPPFIFKDEALCSSHRNGYKFINGVVQEGTPLTPETKIRWLRKRAMRLVRNDQSYRLYSSFLNHKNSREKEMMWLAVEDDCVPAVICLFQAHPQYIAIKDLPIRKHYKEKVEFSDALYEMGYLRTEKALPRE